MLDDARYDPPVGQLNFLQGPLKEKCHRRGFTLSTRNTKLQLGACNHSGDVNQIDAERRPHRLKRAAFEPFEG